MRDKTVMKHNERRTLILTYLYENNEINAMTAAKLIGRSPTTARAVLSRLMDDGLVVTTGANRNRMYKLVK